MEPRLRRVMPAACVFAATGVLAAACAGGPSDRPAAAAPATDPYAGVAQGEGGATAADTFPAASTGPATSALPSSDTAAGVLERAVPQRGTGKLVTVPGSMPAPGVGPVRQVRVEVEGGLPVDPQAFATFAMATLNDPRGWSHGGARTFARTDGTADIHLVLASPDTSEQMCRPLDTGGTLSCRNGPQAIITHHRWVQGNDDYADNLTGYRQYVLNHEVGHVLGHGHVECPGPGEPAPVMQQQTFGLDGCAQNPWPNP